MRMKIAFGTGLGLGFVAGSRAGRGAYDRMVGMTRSIADKPAVRRSAASVQAHAASSAKAAAHTVADSTRDAGSAATQKVHTAWSLAQSRIGHGAGQDDDGRAEGRTPLNGSSASGRRGPSSGAGSGGYSGA
jgi:hypothetical protein